MGRIGETVRRTLQLADVMKRWRSTNEGWPEAPSVRRTRSRPADGSGADDNERVLRYLAKITADPARVHGLEREVGSLLPGRAADLVLWRASSFGVRPAAVVKGGVVAWGPIGEGNASVHGAEPTRYGSDWGATGRAPASLSITFVSAASLDAGIASRLGSARRLVSVEGTRTVRRADLVAGTAVPALDVSKQDGTVRLDGRVLAAEPVDRVPLGRTYLLS
jgi:urease subunit alpha